MKTNRTYWLCQICGWGVYTVIGFAFTVYYSGLRPGTIVAWAAFFGYSIALTHLFRHVIRQRQWALTIGWRSLIRLFAGALTAATTMTVLVLTIDLAMRGHGSFIADRQSVEGLWGGVIWACMIWTILYLVLTAGRRAREKDAALELLRREAEFRALEAKINPHFLFNCLNSIRGLVTEDPPKAQDMITRFAGILRHNLNRDLNRLAPLSEEAQVAADYLALESIRFEDRLRLHLDIPPGAGRALVPPMLLQTLVENALKHGIARLPAGGEVAIRAGLDGDRLTLTVENTGRLVPTAPGGGLGLKIARDRLRLLYADRAKLELREYANTVAAVVTIPSLRPQ
jgi:hypothetical protein